MFAKTIIDSDAFLDMPVTARLLYYDLGMRADDDGFVNSPKKIMRTVGASEDDLRVLLAKRFIIGFENGVIVIKHWRINNWLRQERKGHTPYQDQLARLTLEENGAYTEKADTEQTLSRHEADTEQTTRNIEEYRIGDCSIEEYSIERRRTAERFAPPAVDAVRAYITEKGLNVDPEHFVDYYAARGWKLGKGQPMRDWQAACRTWDKLAKERKAEKGGEIIENFDPAQTFDDAIERSMRHIKKELGYED